MTEKPPMLLLVDGHGLAYRAFYALPPLETSKREKVNALYGFATMLLKVLDEVKPDFVAASFDKAPPSERLREYCDYKAHRQKMPEDLAGQLDAIEKLVDLFGIPIVFEHGHEADDCIGTLAVKAEKEGLEVMIVSADRDFLQLVSPAVKVLSPHRGISEFVVFDEEKVKAKYGLTPSQIVDLKAIAGDSSDNLPGVAGIGDVTARKLLAEFGSLEGILSSLERVPPRFRGLLEKDRDLARRDRKLAVIRTDLDITFDRELFRFGPPAGESLKAFLEHFEFKSLLKKLFPAEILPQADGAASLECCVLDGEERLEKLLEDLKESGCPVLFGAGPGSALSGLAIAPSRDVLYYLPLSGAEEELLAAVMGALASCREIGGFAMKGILRLLLTKGLPLPRNIYDAAMASFLLEPGEGAQKLPSVYRRFAGKVLEAPFEALGGKGEVPAAAVKSCALAGASAIAELVPILKERIAEESLEKVLYEVELPLIAVLAALEHRGIYCDAALLREASGVLGRRAEALEEEIHVMAGEKFNISSPKKLGEILFGKLSIPGKTRTTQGYSTAQDVLSELAPLYPIVDKILEFREVKKLQNTYADALPAMVSPLTGRIHTTFNARGTATGRLSSSEPNLQNIPVRTALGHLIRKAFRPELEGHLLVSVDYSQIELRVMAHLSGDERMIKVFREGGDIHAMTASELFGAAAGDVDPSLRRKAKEINFGILYGMSGHGLAQRIAVSRKEAGDYISRYMERFPAVRLFIERTIREAEERGYVATLFGRKRWIPDIRSRNMHVKKAAERIAINTPVQGSAADIIKRAMIAVDDALQDLPGAMVLQIHDELLFEVEEIRHIELASAVKALMEGIVALSVPMEVHVKRGKNWSELEPFEAHASPAKKEVESTP
ncbi:MAG: DNA polymerase I [Candidatus Eremiobacteraeota bacterium]|nr:DNA polymerase I [Candidatus Eremiobacteraeota bacterium]